MVAPETTSIARSYRRSPPLPATSRSTSSWWQATSSTPAAPSPAAEEIVYRSLLDLADVAPVVIVAGNHDNPARLRAVAPLLSLGRVIVGATIARPDDGGILDLPDLAVRIALVPFIGKRGIVRVEEILRLDQAERIGEYAERVSDILRALTAGMTPDTVNLVLSHLMVAGGVPGGGERTAHLFDYSVPALSFPGHISYVALGHLHRPQKVPAPVPMWYSGSPLQLDFGEGEDRKAVVLVEAEPGLPVGITTRDLRGGRRLRTLRGNTCPNRSDGRQGRRRLPSDRTRGSSPGRTGRRGPGNSSGGGRGAACRLARLGVIQ